MLTVAYAIIRAGDKQFHVTENQKVRVPSISQAAGTAVEFEVLLHGDGDNVEIGAPALDWRVSGTVVEHGRARKIIVFKMKRKKQYKRTLGHRQNFTSVLIGPIGPSRQGSEVATEPQDQTEVDGE
jgi:large subunit ribosomal protein L21